MERRRFFQLAGASLALGVPATALAQVARTDWSATGDAAGREPVDLAALTDEERLHVPVLSLPRRVRAGRAFDLVVQIGLRPHECVEDHRIDWIDVSLGERRVFVADLSLEVPYPVVRVPLVVREAQTLTVRARCTQHGVWRTRRDLLPS